MFGLRNDGSTYVAKADFLDKIKEIQQLLEENGIGDSQIKKQVQQLQEDVETLQEDVAELQDTFSWKKNEEFVHIVTDSDGKVLFGFKADGTPYFPHNEMYAVQSNAEYLAVWTDAAGKVLFGIKRDGSFYAAKADFLDTLKEIQELIDESSISDADIVNRLTTVEESVTTLTDTFSIISNEEYLHAIVDSENKLLFGINNEGKVVLPKQDMYSIISNEEWKIAWLDAAGKPVMGIKSDWTFWCYKQDFATADDIDALNATIQELKEQIESFSLDYIYTVEDVEGRLQATVDEEEKVLSYRDADGKLHENVGIETEELTFSGDGMTKFQQALEKAGFSVDTPVDWSDKDSIYIPTKPTCAYMNITGVDDMPTSKTDDLEATVEVWDMNGNYFKKNVILNGQGNTSLEMYKKNFAADFVDDAWDDSVDIKIGDWVTQDSFHFKAYYTDLFKFAGPVAYNLWEKMIDTRDFCESRPYMEYYANEYTSTDGSVNDDLEQNAQFSALCHPDSFPVIVYLNGDFYGIFSWQLKKDRDNYYTGRNKEEQVHIDGSNYQRWWSGDIPWNYLEVRNPKPKKWDLLCQDGSEYDGDDPQELMGEDSDYYNADDESCVNSAKTKSYILQAANYMSEIAVYEEAYNSAEEGETKTAALATLKEEIEKRWSVSWMIDYLLLVTFCRNSDSYQKNVQWVSWGEINGVEKWFPCPYDLDTSFGIIGTTPFNFTSPSNTWYIGRNGNTPFDYIWDYYYDDYKERYAYFRENGVFTYKTIVNLVLDWVRAIGYDNYELEYDTWDESPCNRDNKINDGWEYANSSYITYHDSPTSTFSRSTTYASGDHVKYDHRCYESLQDNNVGHELTEDEWWKDVSPQAGTYNVGDTVWDGYSNFYKFTATETVVIDSDLNNRPFKKFYDNYPHEGGLYDSIYRISKWIKERIEYLDGQYGYEE